MLTWQLNLTGLKVGMTWFYTQKRVLFCVTVVKPCKYIYIKRVLTLMYIHISECCEICLNFVKAQHLVGFLARTGIWLFILKFILNYLHTMLIQILLCARIFLNRNLGKHKVSANKNKMISQYCVVHYCTIYCRNKYIIH